MIEVEARMFCRNKVDRAIQECQLFHECPKEKKKVWWGLGCCYFGGFPVISCATRVQVSWRLFTLSNKARPLFLFPRTESPPNLQTLGEQPIISGRHGSRTSVSVRYKK
jgi:hypothetical protein